MKQTILARKCTEWDQEKDDAESFFKIETQRSAVQPGSLVIGRYSVLPFYKELYNDLIFNGSKLINSPAQHEYIADLQNWILDLEGFTPKTWDKLENLPEEGPFILKGQTNSKKYQWNTHMFASNKKEAIEVYCKLSDDGLIGTQKIYIREYVPLHTYMINISGNPITKEFRFFVCCEEIVAGGYYWSSHVDQLDNIPSIEEVPKNFLKEVIDRIGDSSYFYVIDVAQTASGEWIVVELNEGQFSGISEIKPKQLYSNLKSILDSKYTEYTSVSHYSYINRIVY